MILHCKKRYSQKYKHPRSFIKFVGLLLYFALLAPVFAANPNDELLKHAEQGNLTEVKTALTAGADVNVKDKKKNTALILAAEGGYIDIVTLLNENDATDLNAENRNDETALMKATVHGHFEIANLLIEEGTNVNITSTYNTTALMHVVNNGKLNTANVLIEMVQM